jgi:phenylpyruvate tautomerase PptA (4-oxalocrotonate tautomerase family)
MPLWHIYCPEGAYSPEDKAAFAGKITDLYAAIGLPRFYVSVLFHDLAAENLLIGGEPRRDFVRIWMDHIARRMPPERRDAWLDRVTKMLDPFVRERGYAWEIHIDETPIELWSIEGMKPPAPGSDWEKRWAQENRAVPFSHT